MPPRPVGRPPKPDHLRQRTHKRKTTDLALVAPAASGPPKPPVGLLASSRRLWRAYWESPVARAADYATDQHVLQRWIEAIDEWQRCFEVFRKTRLVKGSTGQPTLNPLAAYLKQLEGTITYAEQQVGMTPSARARLGITIGQAQLTAEALNTALDSGAEQTAVSEVEMSEVEVWEAEWESA